MVKYLIGFIKNLFNPGISIFAKIDYYSKVNKKSKIWRFVKIYNSTINAYSYVGQKTEIICADIGKYCSIAGESTIGLGTHKLNTISTSSIFSSKKNGTGISWIENNQFEEYKRITIGNDVWIGKKVIIMGGLNIGDGSIIGAGSIVTKDVPAYSIIAGVPGRIIKYRFDQIIIDRLLTTKWWNYPPEHIKKNIVLFQKDDFSINDLKIFTNFKY